LARAQSRCVASSDCRAVTRQENECSGRYRVTHGGPTLGYHYNWQEVTHRVWLLSRDCSASWLACKGVNPSQGDWGVGDSFRGWYDVQGCGLCNDYCRWVGFDGSGGDPAYKLKHGRSWWSCRLAGSNEEYTPVDHFTSWSFTRCPTIGHVVPPGAHHR